MRRREVVKLARGAAVGRQVRVVLRDGAGHVVGDIVGKKLYASEASNYVAIRVGGRRVDIDYRAVKKIIVGKKVR